jgi:alpha-galactosidase
MEIFVKALKDNSLAICFLNRSSRQQNIDFDWKEHMIADTVSNLNIDFNKNTYTLRDLWAKKNIGTTNKPLKQTIGSHEVLMLKLSRVN